MKVPQHLQRYLSGTFSIDLRTLALFRACLGAVLFVALLSRFCDLGAFHADAGVLPRALLMDDPLTWSVHFANGTAAFQGALLALQALAAFCLAIGYRARLAVFLSWFLLLSLHNRNPLVLVPGDDLMGWLLFWGMFLPLAARWSVDAALGAAPAPEQRVLSWASAGLVLQSLGYEKSVDIIHRSECGNSASVGTVVVTDWQWAREIAQGPNCPPTTSLPEAIEAD
jgi:hypothetical protein